MPQLPRQLFAMWLLAGVGSAQAQNPTCDDIKAGIEARMRAGGLSQVQLVVVDATASSPGRVVGTCGQGSKRIVHLSGAAAAQAPAVGARVAPAAAATPMAAPAAAARQSAPAAARPGASAAPAPQASRATAAPAAPAAEPILTECADGSVSLGGDCRR